MSTLVPCGIEVVRALCEAHHGYRSAGGLAVYAWAVYEGVRVVAAYSWQPPPPGAARSVCPTSPAGVLALSRMVAVPRAERQLRHVSKPLRVQMRRLIDRTRWPVLVTYSDLGQGHTGHVYKCSGWTPTMLRRVPVFESAPGVRASSFSNGGRSTARRVGDTWIQRWEHWACRPEDAETYMQDHGWRRYATGGVWRSGAPAFAWRRLALKEGDK